MIHRWINTILLVILVAVGGRVIVMSEHKLIDCEHRLFEHLTKEPR